MFGSDKGLQAIIKRMLADINALKGKGITDIIQGDNITIDKKNPRKLKISSTASGGPGSGSKIDSIVAGDNITVDNTDPLNPIVSVQDITLSGEVTGSTSLSAIDKTAITNKTTETIVGTDYVLFGDTSDSNNLKKGLISDIVALVSGTALSSLTAATASNTINNGNFQQEWQWNSLANNTGFKLSSTSGGLLNTQNRLFEVQMSGAMPGTNSSSYAGYFKNTQTVGGAFGLYAEGTGTAINAVGNINTSTGYYINNNFGIFNDASGSNIKAASSTRLNLRGDNLINFQNIAGTFNYASINNITDNVRQSLLFNGVYVYGQFYCSATTSAMVERSSDKLIFSANSGLTAGTPFTPNNIMTVYGTNSNVGIGTTTPVASAKLEVSSTTSGFLPPRMTATQASAISTPAQGLILYSTDTNGTFTSAGLWMYNGTIWKLILAE